MTPATHQTPKWRAWFTRFYRELNKPRKASKRGVALVIVLGSLSILAVMLTEFQDETSADLGHALSERDGVKAEFAAKSAINLSRLLIASEPTIRRAVAPILQMLFQSTPQIPVWGFSDDILGAFNDKEGQRRFSSLGGFDLREGKNLGMEGAGFEVVIVDEDSKLNVNMAAATNLFAQQRLAGLLLGLMGGMQYDTLFSERDSEGNFHTRQQICSAIIDWTDADTNTAACDLSGQNVQTGSEDGFYQMLNDPYERKNAGFDSLEELHLVRGISDDFWATFIEPDPYKPEGRVVTVWGQGKVNVNTANPQTILALIGAYSTPDSPLVLDQEVQMKVLMVLSLIQSMTKGVPLMGSPKAFINTLKGQGLLGPLLQALELPPLKLVSEAELEKAITTESKVFSIYATGKVQSGNRSTMRRIHAVVDFRGAPAPIDPFAGLAGAAGSGSLSMADAAAMMQNAGAPPNLPADATDATLTNAFRPSPAGEMIYYRVE
jgi:general secretion pathway protein K